MTEHHIESREQLAEYQESKNAEITALTQERKDLYKERKNGDEQTKIQAAQRIEQINAQLKSCRRDVGICKKIFEDAERIEAKYGEIRALSAQKVNMEKTMKDEHERRSR